MTDFRLLVFQTVAENLSFTKASELLNISQPAVTKHIKELERLIGTALFLRQGSRISLTDKGVKLFQYTKKILILYKELSDAFQDDNTTFSGQLRLGASTTIAQYLLPQILPAFKKKYPNIDFLLISGNSEEIAKGLIEGVLEFGMVEGNETNPALHYEFFADDEVVLVTAVSNLKFKADSISIEELTRLPLLIREKGSGTLAVIERHLQQYNLSLRHLDIQMQLGSTEAIKNYLLHSNCFAFISLVAASDLLRDNKLRIVEIDGMEIKRTFRFVSLHGTSSRLADIFKNFCTRSYNK